MQPIPWTKWPIDALVGACSFKALYNNLTIFQKVMMVIFL
jgi:hypothetical protein